MLISKAGDKNMTQVPWPHNDTALVKGQDKRNRNNKKSHKKKQRFRESSYILCRQMYTVLCYLTQFLLNAAQNVSSLYKAHLQGHKTVYICLHKTYIYIVVYLLMMH
jgi:hypothetical protein